MQIDITKLLTNYVSSLVIDGDVIIPNEIIDDVRVIALDNLKLVGKVMLNEEDNPIVLGKLSGNMSLKDDLTLEKVDYPFSIELEEILENNQNILDITDVLWQNILVEIPSKVRKTDEDVTLSGNGWRVISEEEYEKERNSSNPFSELSELLETKEDR